MAKCQQLKLEERREKERGGKK